MNRTSNQFPYGSAPHRLQSESSDISMTEMLLCKDRSVGHDWAHDLVWEDGPEETVGRGRNRATIYTCFRYARCFRCGTLRREEFVQDDRVGEVMKLPNKTRYSYSSVWHDYERLTQGQIRYRLRKERAAAQQAVVEAAEAVVATAVRRRRKQPPPPPPAAEE